MQPNVEELRFFKLNSVNLNSKVDTASDCKDKGIRTFEFYFLGKDSIPLYDSQCKQAKDIF